MIYFDPQKLQMTDNDCLEMSNDIFNIVQWVDDWQK